MLVWSPFYCSTGFSHSQRQERMLSTSPNTCRADTQKDGDRSKHTDTQTDKLLH